jgi:cystathionine beta-lyase/cystathionine gamma-synthase
VRLVQLAVSLGGVESLIEHPATMTHGPMLMTLEDRQSGGITDGLVRIRCGLSNSLIFNALYEINISHSIFSSFSFQSIGLEDPDDLIKDFQQALDKIPENLIA